MSQSVPESAVPPAKHDLSKRVSGDPDLTRAERETTITFADDQERARVHSASPGITRRLLAHDDARLLSATLHDGEGVETVPGRQVAGEAGDIVSVRVTLPVGCVSVKGVARSHNQSAAVVSDGVFEE